MTRVLLVIGCLAASGLLSLIITDLVHRYAVRNAILDLPNHRSLHSNPTPRGGGLGIAVVLFASAVAAAALGLVGSEVLIALLGGLAVAWIGWVDDTREVRPLARALVHFIAAAWAVYWLGGFQSIDVGFKVVQLGWVGSVLAVIGLVWLTNLYNFMDGVDGIAATEAASVAGAGGLLLLGAGQTGLAIVALGICGASLGFLLRNWSPAAIFMGDVASGLLGFAFGVIAIASEHGGALPLLAWFVLLGVFIADSTFTLVRRAIRGEKLYAAHRTHAYQRLVQSGWSHGKISVAVAILNIVLAVAVFVLAFRRDLLMQLVAIAGVLLLGIYGVVERRAPLAGQLRSKDNTGT